MGKVILSRNALDIALLVKKISAEKLQEYDTYPLAFQLGFIHSLPEKDFEVASALIANVGFLGLFPKPILQGLQQYTMEIEKQNQDKVEFMTLVDKLFKSLYLLTSYHSKSYPDYNC
jgi:hypothetical protein